MIIRGGKIVRASVVPADPAFGPGNAEIEVWLDGVLQVGVITADVDAGEILRYRRELGDENGEWTREVVHGQVEIRLKDTPLIIHATVPRKR